MPRLDEDEKEDGKGGEDVMEGLPQIVLDFMERRARVSEAVVAAAPRRHRASSERCASSARSAVDRAAAAPRRRRGSSPPGRGSSPPGPAAAVDRQADLGETKPGLADFRGVGLRASLSFSRRRSERERTTSQVRRLGADDGQKTGILRG